MNKYEIMFIVRPDVDEETRKATVTALEKTLTENGITIEEINDEYMILNANIDEVKTILKEYEDLISITEVNGKVKIQKEV